MIPLFAHVPVITGMGTISAGGKNVEQLWQSALQRRVKVEQYKLKKSHIKLPVYRAELPELSSKDRYLIRQADRISQLLLAAAREAWEAALLTKETYPSDRIGIIIGSSRGPTSIQEEHLLSSEKKPSSAVYSTCSSMAGILATAFSIEGPSFAVASTCTSGATALAMGNQLLQSDVVDLVLVGGVDAPLTESILEQYEAVGILSKQQDPSMALRPFDRDRSGTCLGEGAAVIILESEKLAQRRKVPILGKLNAVLLQGHPGRRASLDSQGTALQQVLKKSLKQSNLAPNQISSIHLHGTATKQNDLIESHVVHTIFGNVLQQPITWANKSITGHVLGASPLFQVILALKTMQHAWIPPITNCDHLDPACKLRISHGEAIKSASVACLNSGFWGNVSSIVISA